MTGLRLLLIATTSVFPGVAAANTCEALLKHGLYNEFARSGYSDSYAEMQSEFCSIYNSYKADHSAGKAKAVYGGFGGKAKFSRNRLEDVGKAMCDARAASNGDTEVALAYSRVVSPAALNSFNEFVG